MQNKRRDSAAFESGASAFMYSVTKIIATWDLKDQMTRLLLTEMGRRTDMHKNLDD
jgi:hypothetical protein